MTPVAVYVHVPFCPSKCGYCDFNSYAMQGEVIEKTVHAIETEIDRSPQAGRPAKSIFFGGGTPTFLESRQLERLLRAVFIAHPPTDDCEITSEANPGTVDMPKFKDMVHFGFNRISLGAQSFHSSDLLRLGRVHSASEIARAVGAARQAGFTNLNLDLMFALPGQSLRAWKHNLSVALDLRPDHLSLYCLTIEPNTRFYRLHQRGMLDLPDDEAQVQMYEAACETCEAGGFRQYEISNFAKPGKQCRHNLSYWRGEEYIGYGPGAVGCVEGDSGVRVRSTNIKHPVRYCEAMDDGMPLTCEREELDHCTLRLERIMLGVRLNEGLPVDAVSLDPEILACLERKGWTDISNGAVRLTPAGRHFCSDVALHLA